MRSAKNANYGSGKIVAACKHGEPVTPQLACLTLYAITMNANPLERVQRQLANAFEKAALGYLILGLRNFFSEQKQPSYVGHQATIGNLAIAVELMLKSYIVRKNLLLLFKNLPVEVRVLMTNPESLPDSFNWQSLEIELRAASYQTIGLDECISLFYLFFPEQKRW